MVHLAHPLGVKAFEYRRVKNDLRDATDLADLLRMGRLPEAWIAPPATRELREARARGFDGKLQPAPFTFDTKKDAVGWLEDNAEGVAATAPRPDPALSDFAERWLVERDLKPRTRADYRLLLDQDILPALGQYRLTRITVDPVHTWYATLDPKTPTLRARTYGLLRTIMITVWQRDLVETNPCRVRGGGSAKHKHQTKIASVPELEAIAAAMPERYRAMILLAGWCALRFGEVTELRRSDVDLAAGVLHISRGVVRVGSTSSWARRSRAPASVTWRSRRTWSRACASTCASTSVTTLVPCCSRPPATAQSTCPRRPCTRCTTPARAMAGRPDLRFHDVRHTGLTLAAATGATLADLMARAGHSTSSTAMIYQHAVADRDNAIAEALSSFAAARSCP